MQTLADRPDDLLPTFDPDPTACTRGPADHLALSENPWLASLYLSRLDRARLRLGAWAERLRALPRHARRYLARRCVTRGNLTRRWTAALPAALLGLALAVGGAGAGMDAGLVIAAPGGAFDGVSIAPDGLCSLREAIINANDDAATHRDCAAGSGADTISLPAGATLTVPDAFNSGENGSSGLPPVTSEIVIEGNAATIRRDPSNPAPFRLLHVDLGNLTLREATVTGGLTHGYGGGIFVGRFRRDNDPGRLRLESVTMYANSAVDHPNDSIYGGSGGGLSGGSGTIITDSVIRNNYATWTGAGISVGLDAVITNSTISSNTAHDQGGGISAGDNLVIVGSTINDNWSGDDGGGGIDAGDMLRITDSTISGNTADDDVGGGISAESDVVITRSIISGNSGSVGGGFRAKEMGGLVIVDSMITGNSASGDGGGIYVGYSPLIRNSTISGNMAGGDGGGIWSEEGAMVIGSTISGNSARGDGGGASVGGVDDDNGVLVVNSTISGNTAGAAAGGLFVGDTGDPSAVITNSTIFGNAAGGKSGGISVGGTVRVANTIIAGQVAGVDCEGKVTSLGHNVEGGKSCAFAAAGDRQDVGPSQLDLGPLAGNGGSTFTHIPGRGSVARDSGDDAICAAAPVGGIDQRGIARPQPSGGRCDIGAVEAMAGEPSPTTPTAPASPTVPLPTATATPNATPTAVPAGPVCPQIVGRVPPAVIDAALANPGQVRGFGELLDPGKPPGPLNPPRRWLSLRSLAQPYQQLGNSVEYKAYCP